MTQYSGSRTAVLTLPTKYLGPIFLPLFIRQIFAVNLLFPQLLVLIQSNSGSSLLLPLVLLYYFAHTQSDIIC